MPFTFEPTSLPGVLLVTPRVFADERGWLAEAYKESEFVAAGISARFVQDNHSLSARHVIRGLHYQAPPKAQAKLVRCLAGVIWDVAVDIRPDSPTYRHWLGVELSAGNRRMLFIPEGFAHGFSVLSDCAEVLYKTTSEYSPEHERGIRWDDPTIAIDWRTATPALSAKDQAWGAQPDS